MTIAAVRARRRGLRPLAPLLPAVVATAAIGLGAGCKAPGALPADLALSREVVETTERYHFEYLLAPGDTLDVVVARHPDVSRACMIRPDGFISVPLLDDVEAAGLTIPELDDVITERLSSRLKDPEVTVVATAVRTPKVYVFGEVLQPRALEARDAETALEAISQAGGINDDAALRQVVVLRLVDERIVATKIDLAGATGQAAPYMALHNVRLYPDDIVFVPKTPIAQFNEWVRQYVREPLTGVNSLLSSYANLKLAENLGRIN